MSEDNYPNDRECELRCIGYALANPDEMGGLDREMFFNHDALRAWEAAENNELPQYDEVASRYRLSQDAQSHIWAGIDSGVAFFKNDLQRLRSLHRRREIILDCRKAIFQAQDLTTEVEMTSDRTFYEVDDVLESVEIEAAIRAATGGIDFGLPLLDTITGGCSPGQLLTIIAPNGCFKTTLALTMLSNALKANETMHGLKYSFEMGPEDLGRRELVGVARHGSLKALAWEMYNSKEAWERTKALYRQSHMTRLHRIYKPMSIKQIESSMKEAKKKYGDQVKLAVIDYLDFIEVDSKLSAAQRVDHIANGLKKVGKRLGIVIILLCQIDKQAARTQYDKGQAVQKKVTRFDALGGQAISNASDLCICLWREDESVVGSIDKVRSPHGEVNGTVNPEFHVLMDAGNFLITGLEAI